MNIYTATSNNETNLITEECARSMQQK